jgi:PAS domain S-box-containing protein
MEPISKQNSVNTLNTMADYLNGYHTYYLDKPYRLDYIDLSLCDIIGYTPTEIRIIFKNKYSQLIYENDRDKFMEFVNKLAEKEQTLSVQYRMLCKDGHIAFINDITTSHKLEDGRMYACSVIADISKMQEKTYTDFLSISDQLVSKYGFLRCTCGKFPKVTYINDQMKVYLGITAETTRQLDYINENIYFMIPFDEREAFQENLEKCLSTGLPLHIEHNFTRINGSSIKLVGWISLIKNEFEDKEFMIICMPAVENHIASRSAYNDAYFLALKKVYTSMFKVNLIEKTVECIHGLNNSAIGSTYSVQVPVKDSISFWLNKHVVTEEYDKTKDFFDRIANAPKGWDNSPVLEDYFHLRWPDGVTYNTHGVAVQMDNSYVLLCCRRDSHGTPTEQPADAVKSRDNNIYELEVYNNESSKENLYKVQVHNDDTQHKKKHKVSLDDTTHDNVIQQDAPANDKVRTDVSDSSPNNNTLQTDIAVPTKGIFARTFGHFDLFVDGIPVVFSNAKEKELMALLIDRNGGTLSPHEAISYLWEGETITDKLSTRYRKLAMTLKNTLTKYGIEHILIYNRGVRSIDVSAITCDYYELISGNDKYKSLFHNAYMSDYSWAEDTLATLWDYS